MKSSAKEMPNLGTFREDATKKLSSAGIGSARLDVLVLLSDELDCDKAWILTHNEYELTDQQLQNLTQQITQRSERVPIAYLRGRQEFYGRDFTVTPDTLIPRPETEALIELLPDEPALSMVDIGTGSGAIAITAKLEHPDWHVAAFDISEDALQVAAHNADLLKADITFRINDLLTNASDEFDIIVANLPYVDPSWERSPETNYEPSLALFATENGISIIGKLLEQAPSHLAKQGYVLLEADPEQHLPIEQLAEKQGLRILQTLDYALLFRRG